MEQESRKEIDMAQYTTRAAALRAARKSGIKGVHKMPNGKWMTGRTHGASKKKKKKAGY